MRIERESTLDLFRGPRLCGYCGLPVKNCSPHHIHSKGSGRLDIKCNLIALCDAFTGGKNCHHEFHAGHEPTREQLLDKVSKREKTAIADIEDVVFLLRRLPKKPRLHEIMNGLEELSLSASRLAMKELTLAGVLK